MNLGGVKIEITMETFAANDDTVDTKINLVFDGANLIGLDQVAPDQVKKATKPKKEKPFKCSKCTCAFTELKQLEVHLTYEHYAFCEVCGGLFTLPQRRARKFKKVQAKKNS